MDKQELLAELKREGFSQQILKAFSKVPREKFIPKHLEPYAYNNEPLPIGRGATISQPYTIAFMLELLELDKLNIVNTKQDKESESDSESGHNLTRLNVNNKIKILEIGSGCGYVLALINEIIKDAEIYGIEILPELVNRSKQVLKDNKNIKIIHGDGSKGLPEEKFDRILISAACNEIPKHLFNQLKRRRGILVCPVRNSIYQIEKKGHGIYAEEFPGFVFVPLINKNF